MANYSMISAYTANRATEAAIEAKKAEARAKRIALESKTEAELPAFFAGVSQLVIDTAEKGDHSIVVRIYDMTHYERVKEHEIDSNSFYFPGVFTERIRKIITETLKEAGYALRLVGHSEEDCYYIRLSWAAKE